MGAVEQGACTLPGGRYLGYAEYGDPSGWTVFYCHGFPGSRLEARLTHETARALRVRIIACDRPGIGLSTPQKGRTFLDWPADIKHLADTLHVERFSVLGVSGGAPFAIACACLLPDRVSALGLVCPLGPVTREGGTSGMSWVARRVFQLMHKNEYVGAFFLRGLFPLLRRFPSSILSLMTAGMPQEDRDTLKDSETLECFTTSLRESLRQGGQGVIRDLRLYSRPWPLALSAVQAPVFLWHGECDATVPVQMGQALAKEIPKVKVHFLASEGHFSLPVRRMEEILGSLLCPDISEPEKEFPIELPL